MSSALIFLVLPPVHFITDLMELSMMATITSRTILPASSTMQTLLSFTDTSSPAKWSMLRFSF
jgi:hypothetical protein